MFLRHSIFFIILTFASIALSDPPMAEVIVYGSHPRPPVDFGPPPALPDPVIAPINVGPVDPGTPNINFPAGSYGKGDIHGQAADAASNNSQCYAAYESTMSECVTGFGSTGGSIAMVMQMGAGVAGGVAGSCDSAKVSGGLNLAGSAVMGTMCYMKRNACLAQCANYQGLIQACNSAFNSFLAQAAGQVGVAGLTMARGGNCNNQTAATTPPGSTTAPYTGGGPGANEPANQGLTPLAPNSHSPAMADTGGGSGGGGLPSSAYPGGASGSGSGGKKDDGSNNNPALGVAGGGGGGGGWPTTAGGGGGNGWGSKGDKGLDLSAFLPGQKGDPSRNPASLGMEITGPNDLTNFQKVTRMMNKKKTTLKNGQGA